MKAFFINYSSYNRNWRLQTFNIYVRGFLKKFVILACLDFTEDISISKNFCPDPHRSTYKIISLSVKPFSLFLEAIDKRCLHVKNIFNVLINGIILMPMSSADQRSQDIIHKNIRSSRITLEWKEGFYREPKTWIIE